MKMNSQISTDNFENLLRWFSPDREEAGRKYEQVREGLIRFFRYRGCDEPELLADETINRVAFKLPELDFSKNVKLMTYFYSFAAKIRLEAAHEKAKKVSLLDSNEYLTAFENDDTSDRKQQEFDCLEQCLASLAPEDRTLMVQYYSKEKKEKMELRAGLAEKLNLKPANLHTRVHRLRTTLRVCLEKCLERKKM